MTVFAIFAYMRYLVSVHAAAAENTTCFVEEFVADAASLLASYAEDVDGDGDIDIMSSDGDAYYWFENNGTVPWPRHPLLPKTLDRIENSLVSGDIDGDGIVDLVTSGFDGLSWHKGNGDVTFNTTIIIDLSASSQYGFYFSRTIVDINKDGYGDIVVFMNDPTLGLRIVWYQGGPDGPMSETFVRGTSGYLTRNYVSNSAIVLNDIDSDGYLDIIGSGFARTSDGYGLAWCKYNNVSGEFEDPIYIGRSDRFDIAVGMIDDDNYVDVATIVDAHSETISYFRNVNGDGTIWEEVVVNDVDSGNVLEFLALADYDNDGKLELVAASSFDQPGGPIKVFELNYPYTVPEYVDLATTTSYIGNIDAADVDNDGRVDLVFSDGTREKVVWLRNGA